MSETEFALMDNSLQYSSEDNRLPSAPLPFSQLLRERHAKYVEIALKEDRGISLPDTKTVETPIDDLQTFLANDYNLDSIIRLPNMEPPRQAAPRVMFHALQEWEGHVLEKGTDEFTARLIDFSHVSLGSPAMRAQEEEEATIPLSEISENDLERLRPGSIFRWVIGYERLASGTKRRISQIVFRDLPVMTERDRSEGVGWAMRITRSLVD